MTTSKPSGNPRQACLQQLQSDLLLGAKAIPFDRTKLPKLAIPADFSKATAQQKRQALADLGGGAYGKG